MNKLQAPARLIKTESLLAAGFIVSIFYGDIQLGIVLPISMLILPLLLVVMVINRPGIFRDFATTLSPPHLLGLLALCALSVSVMVQIASGTAPQRTDLALYAPPIYAIATACACSLLRLNDAKLWKSLIAGGLLLAAVTAYCVAFVPKDEFLISGQDATLLEHNYRQSIAPQRNVTKLTKADVTAVGETDDRSARPYYDVKNLVKSALGRSNYIAAFFVFLFSVALFRRNIGIAVFFALLTAATLSRFGIISLGLVWLIWLIHNSKFPVRKVAMTAVVIGAAAVLLVLFAQNYIVKIPGMQSMTARLDFWHSAIEPISRHFFFGVPRSDILLASRYLITWNPHNVILWVTAIFGFWGALCYVIYVLLAMQSVYRAAKDSPLWKGIFVGLAVLFLWSQVEIIAFTPAFEILLALAYGLSGQNSRPSNAGQTKLAST